MRGVREQVEHRHPRHRPAPALETAEIARESVRIAADQHQLTDAQAPQALGNSGNAIAQPFTGRIKDGRRICGCDGFGLAGDPACDITAVKGVMTRGG
jgi:hypothetical protein